MGKIKKPKIQEPRLKQPNLFKSEVLKKLVVNEKSSEVPIKKTLSNKVNFKQKTKIEKQTKQNVGVKRLKKKDKQILRKEEVLKRIEATKSAFIEDKARRKRQKTEITKDLKPLLDALPSLDSLFKLKSDRLKTGVPAYDRPKNKAQQKLERHVEKIQEFQNKLSLHKSMVTSLESLPANKRRDAIREAINKRKQQQLLNEQASQDVNNKMIE